jgi:hypothetical protein
MSERSRRETSNITILTEIGRQKSGGNAGRDPVRLLAPDSLPSTAAPFKLARCVTSKFPDLLCPDFLEIHSAPSRKLPAAGPFEMRISIQLPAVVAGWLMLTIKPATKANRSDSPAIGYSPLIGHSSG